MNTPRKIVVVEDERDILEMICLSLGRAGYLVYPTRSCSEGHKTLLAEQPLLVLTDNFLPDAEGCDLIRKIKDDPATSAIKTILMTAGSRLSRDSGTGMPDFQMQKPFGLRELNAVVGRMLN